MNKIHGSSPQPSYLEVAQRGLTPKEIQTKKKEALKKPSQVGTLSLTSPMESSVKTPCDIGRSGEVDEIGRKKMFSKPKDQVYKAKKKNVVTATPKKGAKKTKSVVESDQHSPIKGKGNPVVKGGVESNPDSPRTKKKPPMMQSLVVDRSPPSSPRLDDPLHGSPKSTPITPQVKVTQTPPPKLDPVKTLQEVRTLESGATASKEPSQKILGEMMTKLKTVGFDKVDLTADLGAKSPTGSFEVEPYKIDSEPDKTFYRVKVTYKLTAEQTAPPKGKETFTFSKIVSTLAPTPESAIMVATALADQRRAAALSIAGFPGPFDTGVNKDFIDAAKTGNACSFKVARNAAGDITHLQSANINKDKDGKNVATHNISYDSQPKYVYDFKKKEYTELDSTKGLQPGQRVFDTEVQKLLHERGVVVKNDKLYEELEKKGELAKHGQVLQEEIKKQQEAFAKIKGNFIQDPSFALFRKKADPVSTEAFEHFKANAKAFHLLKNLGEGEQVSPDILEKVTSPEIQGYARVKKEIRDLKSRDKAVDKDLATLDQLKKGIDDKSVDPSAWDGQKIQDFWGLVGEEIASDPNVAGKNIKDAVSTALTMALKAKSEEKQKITIELAAKNNQLKALEKEIGNSQGSFNDQLKKMHEINRDLSSKLEQLKELQAQAQKIVDDEAETDLGKKQQAQAFVGIISKKAIEDLEGQITKHQEAIDTILKRLGDFDATVLEAHEE